MDKNCSGNSSLNGKLRFPSAKPSDDCDEQNIFICILVIFLKCVSKIQLCIDHVYFWYGHKLYYSA